MLLNIRFTMMSRMKIMMGQLTHKFELYEDDDNTHDQIYDVSRDNDADHKFIFYEYQEYEETPFVIIKQIDQLDGINLANNNLEGADWNNVALEGADVTGVLWKTTDEIDFTHVMKDLIYRCQS